MRNKRDASQEERELFEEVLSDSRPLKKVAPQRRRVASPKPQAHDSTPARQALSKSPRQRPAGLDGNTADKLRRGLLEPQARLDLHGLTERAAHAALVTFLRSARSRMLRLVLVVTGKGSSANNEPGEPCDAGLQIKARGVLRTMTPRWLAEPALAEIVADVREAHRRHGGGGALYIYLRKADRP